MHPLSQAGRLRVDLRAERHPEVTIIGVGDDNRAVIKSIAPAPGRVPARAQREGLTPG